MKYSILIYGSETLPYPTWVPQRNRPPRWAQRSSRMSTIRRTALSARFSIQPGQL